MTTGWIEIKKKNYHSIIDSINTRFSLGMEMSRLTRDGTAEQQQKRFVIFPPDWGMLRRSRRVLIFL